MKIVTEFIYPPIPIRQFDWSAVDDDTYDGANAGEPMGWGETEAEAVADLLEQIRNKGGNVGFKAEMQVLGDPKFYSNALVFATRKEAESYASDLFSRWTLTQAKRVVEVDEVPNYQWDDSAGRAVPLAAEKVGS